MVAVMDQDAAHHPRLGRLDELHLADRHDLAGGGGDDLGLAEHQPGGERGDAGGHHPPGQPRSGRHRPLDHFQRGGEEGGVVDAQAVGFAAAVLGERGADRGPVCRDGVHAATSFLPASPGLSCGPVWRRWSSA